MSIEFIDRKTGKLEEEKIYGARALTLFYGDSWASLFLSYLLMPFLSKSSLFSRFYGWLQDLPRSAKKVAPFIRKYQIDLSEFEKSTFVSFNDFFTRKLKAGSRIIEEDPVRACVPADGRCMVFPDLTKVKRFYIKGQSFDLESFLQSESLSNRYKEGSMAIFRLCPTDYHRFHFISDGNVKSVKPIQGGYHSVSPIALRKNISILWTNKRVVTDFETEILGRVQFVEVGAICVGTIHQTFDRSKRVHKGDEKGYFSFGGSCMVLLFEKNRIAFDEDLVRNSDKGIETRVLFGESLGRSIQ